MTNIISKHLTFGCTLAALIIPMAASAQQGPPIGEIATELNVSEGSLKACMPRPTDGSRPPRPDPSAIATCLKADNGAITEQTVAEVLEAFKPERPPRQD